MSGDELDRRIRSLEAERMRPVPRPPPAKSELRAVAILAQELHALGLRINELEEAED